MLELLGLSAAALGALSGTREAAEANLRYLLVGLLGSMTYLLGVALLYTAYGSAGSRSWWPRRMTPGPVAWAALALMIGGLLLKAALFPMHFWLPPAHASAPAPVSAALSALVVKAAVYLVLRLWVELFDGIATLPAAGLLLGLLGTSARCSGAPGVRCGPSGSSCSRPIRPWPRSAICFIFFPLLTAIPPGAERERLLTALVLLALTHGFAKAGFFLAAGLVQKSTGHDRIRELGGAAQSLPAATLTMGLAGVALIGLPPSGTFFGKWVLLGTGHRGGSMVVGAGRDGRNAPGGGLCLPGAGASLQPRADAPALRDRCAHRDPGPAAGRALGAGRGSGCPAHRHPAWRGRLNA
jgi:multicomponent Na+:H+ antiporter subunit D